MQNSISVHPFSHARQPFYTPGETTVSIGSSRTLFLGCIARRWLPIGQPIGKHILARLRSALRSSPPRPVLNLLSRHEGNAAEGLWLLMFARVSICPPRLPRLLLVTVVTALSAMSRGAGMASTTAPPPGASNGVGYPAKAAAAGTPIAGAAVGFGANAGGRTGILIHGCHLGAKGWQKIMWGDERLQRLGR